MTGPRTNSYARANKLLCAGIERGLWLLCTTEMYPQTRDFVLVLITLMLNRQHCSVHILHTSVADVEI